MRKKLKCIKKKMKVMIDEQKKNNRHNGLIGIFK